MRNFTALVTILAVVLYFSTGLLVAKARRRYDVKPPATTGHPDFERVFRVQMNTLEWMPIFLPLLWLCAFYLRDWVAGALGLVWIGGRICYILGYSGATEKRHIGFLIQTIACLALFAGALAGLAMTMMR
jgi:glutathione S-transferase